MQALWKKLHFLLLQCLNNFFLCVGCHLNALTYCCTVFFQRISFLLYFISVAGVFLIPKLAMAPFVQCRHVSSLNTRIYQLLQTSKTVSFFFSATVSGFSQEPLRISFMTHVSGQYFLSLKNIPHVLISTKHLNILSQCCSITCMKHGSQTPSLKHTTRSPWSNTSSAALVARNRVRRGQRSAFTEEEWQLMQMFWKLKDMNDGSKSTWQAKIQFACIDRHSGKIRDKLF